MRIKILLLFIIGTICAIAQDYELSYEEEYEDDAYFEGHNPDLNFESDQEYHNWNYEYDDTYRERYNGEAFTYTEPEEKAPEEISDLDNKLEVGFNLIGLIMKILLIAAIALVLYLVIKALMDFRVNRNKKIDNAPIFQSQEKDMDDLEDLEDSDLRALIERAKIGEDFTLAVRYYFLLYLQRLQEFNFISYHRDKTNHDYLLEIDDDNRNLQFIKISQLFEYIWYGKKPINESSFKGIEQLFNEQISAVK